MEVLSPELLSRVLRVAVILAAPPVLTAAAAGVLVGVAQAVTQIQDQALSLALRLTAVALALGLFGPWAFDELVRLTTHIFTLTLPGAMP